MTLEASLDEIDRRIVLATQSGLPLEPQPYHALPGRWALPPKR